MIAQYLILVAALILIASICLSFIVWQMRDRNRKLAEHTEWLNSIISKME